MKNYCFRPMVLFLFFISIQVSAQTEQENHEKYWLFRHQLRERFMRVGTDPGESLPASVIIPGASYGPEQHHKVMHWRDATISLGHYLIVLATEYRLLQQNGQETTTTENELYYALKAAIRLDQYCEHFTTGGAYGTDPGFINGLMMRDDVPHDFHLNWLGYKDEHPVFDFDNHHPDQIHSDFAFNQGYGSSSTLLPYNEKNIQSIDQVVSILLGMRFVLQLVDNIDVQPTPSETALNIHQTARDIIWRLIARMNDTGSAQSPHEWIIKHENGQLVPRGNNAVMASYPLIKLMEYTHGPQLANFIEQPGKIILQVSQEDYCESPSNTWVNGNTLGGWTGIVVGNILGTLIGAPFAGYDAAIYNSNVCNGPLSDLPIEGPMPIRLDIDDIGEIWHDFNDSYALASINQTSPLILINPDFDFEIQNIFNMWVSHEISPPMLAVDPALVPKAFDQVNIHLLYELAVLGGIWDSQYLATISQISNLGAAAMMNAVLHDNSQLPINFDMNTIKQKLDCMPASGAWSNPFSLAVGCNLMGSPNLLFLPDDASTGPEHNGVPDWEYRGLYPCLDYMVIYNLMRLLQNNPSEPAFHYRPNCQCKNVLPIQPVHTGIVEINPQFEEYFERNLPIETFVTRSATITGENAALLVNNDAILCSRDGDPVELVVENGADVIIKPGRTITIRENCSFKIHEASLQLLMGNSSERPTAFVVEQGGKLIVESNTPITLNHSFSIENKGGDVFFDNSTVSISNPEIQFSYTSSKQGNMEWNYVSNAEPMRFNILANEQSSIQLAHCDLQANLFGLVDEQTGIYINNTQIASSEGDLDFVSNSFILSDESHYLLSNTEWTFGSSSDFHTHLCDVAISDGSKLTFKDSNTAGSSQWVFDKSQVTLDGDDSEIILDGGKLFIGENSTFDTQHPSGEAGVMRVQGNYPTQIILETDAAFILNGDGINNLMLDIAPSHQLQFVGLASEVSFHNGLISMSQNTSIESSCKTIIESSSLQNNMPFEAAVYCYYGPLVVTHSAFSNVELNSQHSKTAIGYSSFTGPFSRVNQNYGSIVCTDSQFYNTELHLHLLNTASTVSKCTFNNVLPNVYQAIGDNSQVELYLSENQITGYMEAVAKMFGKLSMRCNYIADSEIGVYASKCILNMSSSSNAGYNHLENNQTHIYCSQATDLLLVRGFNILGPFSASCIEGTVSKPCDSGCQQATINAICNQWVGNVNNGMFLETTGFLSSCNGQQCPVWFNDPSPVFGMVCANTKPALKPVVKSSFTNSSDEDFLNARSANELVYLTGYGEIPLDSALGIAAMTTEMYDSLGNDALAVDLFHEILSNPIDLGESDNRKMVEWGIDYMKSALENMFYQNEIRPEQNRTSFQASVKKYVDILNSITTEEVADTLVATQFYLELNKGHLFRLIHKPEIALTIYNNLLNCPLDSAEMNSLASWITQIENEISIVQSYSQGELASPEDITEGSLSAPPLEEEEYRFGVFIHSPNAVSFVDCTQLNFLRGHGPSALLFPNPAHDKIHINFSLKDGEEIQVNVFDLSGRCVLENGSSLTLDVSSWNAGAYVLQLSCGDQKFKELFVVEH